MQLIINGYVITEPIESIIYALKREANWDVFKHIEPKDDYLRVTCPFHKDGHESHPSCSIYTSYDSDSILPGTFHCFRAGTKVITKNGIKNIEELVNKPTSVINGNGEWEETQFKCYGTAPLIKLTLKRENIYNTIYCTANHEWFVGRKREIKSTEQLCIGDYLASQYHYAEDFELIEEAVRHGIIYADGTKHLSWSRPRVDKFNGKKRYLDKSKMPTKCSYTLNISELTSKVNLISFFETSDWSIRKHVLRKCDNKYYTMIRSHRMPIENDYKTLPDLSFGRNYIMSFLAGYFACDGSIVGKSFSTTSYEDMLKLRDLFIFCGISIRNMVTTIRGAGKTFLKDRESILYTTKIILETLPEKFFINNKPLLENKKYIRGRWKIDNIEKTNLIEPVYCCETSTQSFVIDENILTHNCFSCGESATLYQAVAHILNISEDEAKDWLINKYGDWAAKEDLYFPAWEPPEIAKNTTYLDESILEQYKYYHPYMAQRKIPLDVVKKFTVGYNQEKNTITFPVWDEDDHLVMITERSVTNKTFYIPKNIEKPIYLFNFIKKEMPNFLFICESQINALTCWSYNLPAVALIGTGTEKQYDILRKSGIRNYILCFDGDNAGRKGAARFKKALAKTETSITDIIMPDGKDVNDLSKEEFKIILQNYGLNLIS